MKPNKNIKRRTFVSTVSKSAAAFTIVPRHVLGKGYVPPSDKINVANIGCGTQGIREMPGMLENEEIHVKAVCDVNKYSTDYLDWSPKGIVNGIQRTLGNKDWGKYISGIPGGRDLGQEYVQQYYGKSAASGVYNGCNAYEDFRELLAKESDIDVVKIMTPDHTHAAIAMAAAKRGIHVVTHKPISNRLLEGLSVIDSIRENQVKSHLLAWSDKPTYRLMKEWMDQGVIGELKEIHNWSVRPVWPQYPHAPSDADRVPNGFNWQLWLGPEKDRPFSHQYTHNVFRGWYDFGGGSIADMGHYSLFPLFRTLGINHAPRKARAFGTATRTSVDGVCRSVYNDAAFPYSCMIKFQFDANDSLPEFDLFWYDGGMRPFAPEELEREGLDVGVEGLMIVGTKGKIISGFEGENPKVYLTSGTYDHEGIEAKEPERRSNTWARAVKSTEESPGSFLHAGPITETLNLGAVALRARRSIEYDNVNKEITNDKSLNRYLTRDYRDGWEV